MYVIYLLRKFNAPSDGERTVRKINLEKFVCIHYGLSYGRIEIHRQCVEWKGVTDGKNVTKKMWKIACSSQPLDSPMATVTMAPLPFPMHSQCTDDCEERHIGIDSQWKVNEISYTSNKRQRKKAPSTENGIKRCSIDHRNGNVSSEPTQHTNHSLSHTIRSDIGKSDTEQLKLTNFYWKLM